MSRVDRLGSETARRTYLKTIRAFSLKTYATPQDGQAQLTGSNQENVEMTAFGILSPGLDQSVFVARLLARHYQEATRVGIAMPGERVVRNRRLCVEIMPLQHIEHVRENLILIPTGSSSTRYLLERGNVTLGDVEMDCRMLEFFDKTWAIGQAQVAGIPVPKTWTSKEAIPTYPVFYKSTHENGGGPRGIARRESQIPKHTQGDLLFQEVIQGRGTYGVGFIARGGQIVAHECHFESESVPRTGGSAVVIERYHDDRLECHTRNLVRHVNYSGWGLAEYKYCPIRRDFTFMEVNAKLWASCEFSFTNNPSFARMLFGVDLKRNPIQRMIFLERALRRGFGCLPIAVAGLERRHSLRLSPGWATRFVAAVLRKADPIRINRAID